MSLHWFFIVGHGLQAKFKGSLKSGERRYLWGHLKKRNEEPRQSDREGAVREKREYSESVWSLKAI